MINLHLQGVQAQTVANFYLAFEAELTIIPVLNKLDLKTADPEEVNDQINTLFDIDKEEILAVSKERFQYSYLILGDIQICNTDLICFSFKNFKTVKNHSSGYDVFVSFDLLCSIIADIKFP